MTQFTDNTQEFERKREGRQTSDSAAAEDAAAATAEATAQEERAEPQETAAEEIVLDFAPETPVETERPEEGAAGEMQNKYLRLQADFENFKKRNALTAVTMYNEGVADVLETIFPILDTLELALQSQKDEAGKKGVELVTRSFTDALSKFGVEEIEALGAEFDPQIHEAAFSKDAGEENSGKVLEVYKKGYRRGDKILRHPMVVVGQ